MNIKNRLLLPTLFAGLLLFDPDGAAAATLTVTNTSDSGAGSLRQAILDAASGDTINFSLPAGSTITLTSAELFIAKDVLTITGPGSGNLLVQRSTDAGTPNFGIFDIGGQSNVTISGLTISNGNNTGNDGGGILNQSTKPVTISDCQINGNSTTTGLGGGLSNRFFATITVANCTFNGNSSTGGANGGGIYNEGTMDVTNSTITMNSSAFGNGGGFFNSGTATFTDCVFSNNTSTTGNGAGLYNDGTATLTGSTLTNNASMDGGNGGGAYNDGTLTLTNCTVTANFMFAGGNGAGIYNLGTANVTATALLNNSTNGGGNGGGVYNDGTTNLTNSTLYFNYSIDGGSGGGIDNDDGTVNVTNCTISNNAATSGGGSGGGILTVFGSTLIKNTIVAVNMTDGSGPDVAGDFTSLGFNLIGESDGSTGFTNGVNGDQVGTIAVPLNPLLGPPKDNGGPTFTQAVLFGSPAIDKGAAATDPATGNPITTDQRGMARPVDRPDITNATGGDGSDIGAFEVQTPPSQLLNISTRLDVLMDDDVLIGGFIITGTESKTVAIRAIGPSLGNSNPPVTGTLADPVLELHEPDGRVVTNNDWMTNNASDQAIIVANGLDMYNGMPISDLESILIATLPPADSAVPGSGEYTAIVHGNGSDTGVGLVEVYDLDQAADSQLANISTRGLVQTEDNVMIGGFIVGGGGGGGATVLVRALGPSLLDQGVNDALLDPTLDLYDVNGTGIASNDNWQDTQEAEITATGIPPSVQNESAIEDFLLPGNYTAIVRGNQNTTGVALVEVYHLN